MFKNAARKIAHNTTVPALALAGKRDLRPLQDLITAEKAVLNSLQRLSADFARAAEALRLWGQGEGDDLGDTLTASNALFLQFSSALSALASHEVTIREQMKSIRTREENLDELKRRRRSVFSDSEAAERKLSKMNPDHKNLQQQTENLNRLREEIRQMDTDIMDEEAGLGDFKRATVRSWMSRKFGGLLECCEKGSIIGELGKQVIGEIPLEPTQPGLPRTYYTGHARTELLVGEAARSVSEVTYLPDPDPSSIHRRPLGPESLPMPQQRRMSVVSASSNPYVQPGSQLGYVPSPGPASYVGLPQVEETGFSIGQFATQDSSFNSPLLTHPSVNEFGTYSSPPISNQPSTISAAERDMVASSSPRGGRFATFPVKAAGPRPQPSQLSFTNPYVNPPPPIRDGDRAPSIELDRNDESFSSSVTQALNRFSAEVPPGSPPGPSTVQAPRSAKGGGFAPQRYSPPPPMYTPSDGQGLPAGAAPSSPPTAMSSQSGDGHGYGNGNAQGGLRPQSAYDGDEGLAYMSSGRGNESTESLSNPGDRRVRFGGVSDVDAELERRRHEEEQQQQQPLRQEASPGQRFARVPVPAMDEGSNGYQDGRTLGEEIPTIPSPPASPLPPGPALQEPAMPSIPSIPQQSGVLTPPATEILTDENALNAAAAREVSRELDALMISPTTSSPVQDRSPPSPITARPYGASPSPFNRQRRDPSPISSPSMSSASSSQPTGPNLYVRERDRTLSSPVSSVGRKVSQDGLPPLPAPASPVGSDSGQGMPPTSQGSTNGTPYRTPIATPSASANAMYNMPGTADSNGSFSAQTAPAPARMISAAAFRRPQGPPRTLSSDNVNLGPADVTPLNVKKRPLPSSPYPGGPSLGPGMGPNPGLRAVSQPTVGGSRPVSASGEEEFDYISAYTDGENRASGYGSGRFSTNVEDGVR